MEVTAESDGRAAQDVGRVRASYQEGLVLELIPSELAGSASVLDVIYMSYKLSWHYH